jgi:hypothetical protein
VIVKNKERQIWALLIRDFFWQPEPHLGVEILKLQRNIKLKKAKFQLFEVLMTVLLAQIRPEYRWYVTPNRADHGIDFIGKGPFLNSEELGIAAAITVGGQCKKRNQVSNIVEEVAGSLARMARIANPTFFVIAFSANLNRKRIEEAQDILEHSLQRHCHILERSQIEALIRNNIDHLYPIIRLALTAREADFVHHYFMAQAAHPDVTLRIDANAPNKVLAGEAFRVSVKVSGSIEPKAMLWLRWLPHEASDDKLASDGITLIGPIGGDTKKGIHLNRIITQDDNPFLTQVILEFITFAVGNRDLGKICLEEESFKDRHRRCVIQLPSTQVVENLRPRFYERPCREIFHAMREEYEKTRASSLTAVSISGSGGAGKSRVCEEFAIEVRRDGGIFISAKQANSQEYPRRILVNLLIALDSSDEECFDLADSVLTKISRYDPDLAVKSRSAIRGLIGSAGKESADIRDQILFSVFILLIFTRSRNRPLVIHLHDLHWCTPDVLEFIERLIWQLEHLHSGKVSQPDRKNGGVMFILEGRTGEKFSSDDKFWSTRPFELFISRLERPTLTCRAYTPEESKEFTRRLFEDKYSAFRKMPLPMIELHAEISDRINNVAGGNPFHILEQVKFLKQKGILAQNYNTGLLYIIRPQEEVVGLPVTVFTAIEARWRYLETKSPRIALLIWSVAFLSDRIPVLLFRRLWRGIALNHSLKEIEMTEFLRIPSTNYESVAILHENYFQALRSLQIGKQELQAIIEIYGGWFQDQRILSSQQKYDWARVLLEADVPDFKGISRLLRSAQRNAINSHDYGLACRVLTILLDVMSRNQTDQLVTAITKFVKVCDNEILLCKLLIATGDRELAIKRADTLVHRIEVRISQSIRLGKISVEQLHLRKLQIRVVQVRTLMNFGEPAKAVEISTSVVEELKVFLSDTALRQNEEWRKLEMDAYHAHSVSLALSGDTKDALLSAEHAVSIARKMDPKTDDSLHAISTYANILLSKSPAKSERILRICYHDAQGKGIMPQTRIRISINLAMALLLRAHNVKNGDVNKDSLLDEVFHLLDPVFTKAFALGRFSDAAAVALVIGLAKAESNSEDESLWFAQSVSSASRGHQMETLWRAHLNLATSLGRRGYSPKESVRDHAHAALIILIDTLSPYADPENSPRFNLIRIPLAQAVRFLIKADDPYGRATLAQFPSLRKCFRNVELGSLHYDRGGYSNHEWLQFGEFDYILY